MFEKPDKEISILDEMAIEKWTTYLIFTIGSIRLGRL